MLFHAVKNTRFVIEMPVTSNLVVSWCKNIKTGQNCGSVIDREQSRKQYCNVAMFRTGFGSSVITLMCKRAKPHIMYVLQRYEVDSQPRRCDLTLGLLESSVTVLKVWYRTFSCNYESSCWGIIATQYRWRRYHQARCWHTKVEAVTSPAKREEHLRWS